MIHLPTSDNIKDLASQRAEVCISIYVPTFRSGKQTKQGPIHLKGLLKQAEQSLLDLNFGTPSARKLLKPAKALLQDSLFWQHQSDGLAIFLTADGMDSYQVPLHFEELVVVAERFHVKPLFQMLTTDGPFFILAISQNAIRLLRCTRHSCESIDLDDIPTSMAQALQMDDPQKQLQLHSGGGGQAAIFHGQGAGADDVKTRILQYFQSVDKGLQKILRDEQVPLVLAGVDYLLPIYRNASSYAHLVEDAVIGNPEEVSDQKLHESGWNIIKPIYQQGQDQAIANLERLANSASDRASLDLENIVSAAVAGRVETLLVTVNIQRWGRVEPDTGRLHLHERAEPGDQDLLDFASVHTFLNGGIVYAVNQDDMPDQSAIGAIFRY